MAKDQKKAKDAEAAEATAAAEAEAMAEAAVAACHGTSRRICNPRVPKSYMPWGTLLRFWF